jgi:hypothetical protein
MKNTWIGIIAGIMAICGLKAQENGNNLRRWEQGALTWDDFSRTENVAASTGLYYLFSCDVTQRKYHDTIVNHIQVQTYANRDSSRIRNQQMSNEELRFQQLVFDLAELQSRILQQSVNRLRRQTEVDSFLQEGMKSLNQTVEDLETASKQGSDMEIVGQWETKVRQQLASTPDSLESIPSFTPTLFGFGADVGIGYHLLTSPLGEKLKGSPNVQIGVNFALGRSELLLNACLGGSKVRKDSIYISGEKWSATDHLEFCQLSASYGFRLLDRKHLQMTPFIGYGYTEISTIPGQNDEVKHKAKTGGFQGGLCLDYKLRTSLSLIPSYLKNKEMYNISIRTKLYVTQTGFTNLPEGYIFNCALMVKIFDQFIRLD